MTENRWEATTALGSIGMLPWLIIIIAMLGWLLVGVVWLITLIINVITIMMGSFVIIIIEWLFLAADWVLMWLGPFIARFFTQDQFFNWLNSIYLVLALGGIGFVIDLVRPQKEVSKDTTKTVKPTLKSTSQGKTNGTRPRNGGTQKTQGQPVGLLDAMRGGMQLEAYLPQDVTQGLQETVNSMLTMNKDLDTPEGRRRLATMMQLQMNFEVLHQHWNTVKSNEARMLMEGIADKMGIGSQPVPDARVTSQDIHKAMLKNIEQTKKVGQGEDVDLEHPALGWIELGPVVKQMTQGKLNVLALQDQQMEILLKVLYSHEYPRRYHHTTKGLHSDRGDDVISSQVGYEGIPLSIARIELLDYDWWFALDTIGGMRVERNGKPTLVSTRPEGLIVSMMARIGTRPDHFTKETFDEGMALLTQFIQNPTDYRLRVHYPMELIENYLSSRKMMH